MVGILPLVTLKLAFVFLKKSYHERIILQGMFIFHFFSLIFLILRKKNIGISRVKFESKFEISQLNFRKLPSLTRTHHVFRLSGIKY
jgi:hypothetical protein